ncbi:MAG: monovalent cation/H+ antiporter complex subunit F [Candidatus Aenigmatarchaeota archaeon]
MEVMIIKEPIELAILLLFIAIIIALIRAVKGPSVADRVIAADVANSIAISIIVLIAIFYKIDMLADIAIIYAMLSFLGTLAISKYLMKEKGGSK